MQVLRVVQSALIDAALVILAYLMAYSIRIITAPDAISESGLFIAFAIFVNISSLYLYGVYRRIWSRTSGHGITLLFQAGFVSSVLLVALDLLITPRPVPLSVVVVAQILSFGGHVVVRYRSRLIPAALWRWRAIWSGEFPAQTQREKVLIIGAGESGQMTAMRLLHHSHNKLYEVVGFVDDAREKQGLYVEGRPVLGPRSAIPRLVDEYQVDLIVMSIHNIKGADFREVLQYCEQTKARIKVVPDMMALLDGTRSSELLRDVRPEDLIGRSPITRHESVDLTPVTNKVVLVTGAAGSIGSEISRQMVTYSPRRVYLLDNNESDLHDLCIELKHRHPDVEIQPVLADITYLPGLQQLFEREVPQIIFHAAAYKHVPMMEDYPGEALRVNVGGTRNLALLARDKGVERFVLISTDKAVNPSSVMGASKRICELLILALAEANNHQTCYTAVRFGNVLGSRGSVVPTFKRQIEQGGPVTITHPEMTRYFMSISEASNLVIHAACLTQGQDIFVLRMGEVVLIQDIAERMIRLRGLRPHIDVPIRYTGVRPGEKMHENLFDDGEEPEATVHPHIMKVSSPTNGHSPADILERVKTLVDNLATSPQPVLDDFWNMAHPTI